MVDEQAIKAAQERFGELLRRQLERVDVLKGEGDWIDYSKLDKLIIGVCGGDGIGPYICASAQRVMEFLLADKIKAGKAEIRQIDGLTIERRVEVMKAIPDDTLEELKKCHVILKGPTTTPKKGDPWPNIESANVAMRKQLDLFANVRPVSVPELGIDWVFYRENTEGSYALGSDGVNVTDDLAMDFCVATTQGTERIIRAGFEHAKKTGKNYVSLVTKANIIKTTDGKFLTIAENVAKDYPDVKSEPVTVTVERLMPVSQMVMSTAKVTLFIDETKQLSVRAFDAKKNELFPEYSWVSSNTKVASVTGDGVVTAIAKGYSQLFAGLGFVFYLQCMSETLHRKGNITLLKCPYAVILQYVEIFSAALRLRFFRFVCNTEQ